MDVSLQDIAPPERSGDTALRHPFLSQALNLVARTESR